MYNDQADTSSGHVPGLRGKFCGIKSKSNPLTKDNGGWGWGWGEWTVSFFCFFLFEHFNSKAIIEEIRKRTAVRKPSPEARTLYKL